MKVCLQEQEKAACVLLQKSEKSVWKYLNTALDLSPILQRLYMSLNLKNGFR